MTDRLLVDIDREGRARVSSWLDGQPMPSDPHAEHDVIPLAWPLSADELEDLRWYLEDYLRMPFGVYEDRGPRIAAQLPKWGERLFMALFGSGAGRKAYETVRKRVAQGRRPEVVVRSEQAAWLALPWELLYDPRLSSPLALEPMAISRSLPAVLEQGLAVGGERLRVLMVISRPRGTDDVGYRMIARPLLARLSAVSGKVELVILRPPTLQALSERLQRARAAGKPFHMVHFDGHGKLTGGHQRAAVRRGTGSSDTEGFGQLVFEKPDGGPHYVAAVDVARVLAESQVPVVILNACQSGSIGKQLESAVATRLLAEGASAVVAMAYKVYTTAAAEFMTAFYESLFAGNRVSDAVTAGRARLVRNALRPSPRGRMPLEDWAVPVHYMRRDVQFPSLHKTPAEVARDGLSLDTVLDRYHDAAGSSSVYSDDDVDEWAPSDEFVGRDGLFYKLELAARLKRVALLYGLGGVGKTELAKAFGRWWRDTGAVDDPRLIIWHSFEPGVERFGLDGVLHTIGIQVYGAEFAKLDDINQATVVRDLLTDRRVLVVFDNFESVHSMPDTTGAASGLDEAGRSEMVAFLQDVASGGHSSVVITSRNPEVWLGNIERIPVAGLDTEEADEYADTLIPSNPDTLQRRRRRAFGELIEWLDGHPLSMRLTLPLLATTEPDMLLAGLRGAIVLDDSSHDGQSDDPGASLPACITYSITHLSHEAQRLLVVSCLFHGVVDAIVLSVFSQATSTVPHRFAGLDAPRWRSVLDAAAAVGLLTRMAGSMYAIHPVLPSYLAAQWRSSEPETYSNQRAAAETALREAYAVFATWLTDAIDSGRARQAFMLMDGHRRTLSQMLGTALDQGDWDHAHAIVTTLNTYWNARGLYSEARGWVLRARRRLESPESTPPNLTTPGGQLWLFLVQTEAERQAEGGRLADAATTVSDVCDKLLSLPRSDVRDSGLARAYHQLGVISQKRGLLDEAVDWYRKSLAISERLGMRYEMAVGYHQLGMVQQMRWVFDDAQVWYRRALRVLEELGDWPTIALVYHQLGTVSQMEGSLKEAAEWFGKSLAINEQLRDLRRMAANYHQLGTVAQMQGSLDAAMAWYHQALRLKELIRDLPGMATTYHDLGMVAQRRGFYDEAEDWYLRSLAIEREIGNLSGIASSLGQLGRLAEAKGNAQEALEWTVRCVTVFDTFPHPSTGVGPLELARLTGQLGLDALRACWLKVTGRELPAQVISFVRSGLRDQ